MARLLLLAAAVVTLAGAGCQCTGKCFGWGKESADVTPLPSATANAGGTGGVVQTGAKKQGTNPDAGMTQAGFNIQGVVDGCADGKCNH